MSEESIKLAVRVRPFNQREKDRNAKLVIRMEEKSTFITDPRLTLDEAKQFSFDYSYWSHDGFIELPSGILEASSSASCFASQQKIFNDLGRDILKNAFEGFNCSLFAYGQTGSGKSYSMLGYGINRGLIPMISDELFREIDNQIHSNIKVFTTSVAIRDIENLTVRFEVTLSMMEIYNEQVRDLLTKEFPKGGLTVRQHPTSGYFYAQGLRMIPIGSYTDIERRINEGTANRTIAATNMNTTSSRAHTVVTIYFDQIIKYPQREIKKTSVINLIDLAGSERLSNIEISRDRLRESTNINRSLSTLGNVISALVDIASGVKRKIVVPYRESILTKLLQNSLGGNSKTIMFAALSPADANFEETLSTLRFADRVKRIKNLAVINENPIDKLIRQLKEENQRLKVLFETGNYNLQLDNKPGMTSQDIELRRKQMEEEIIFQIQNNQKIIQDENISWDTKLKNAQLDNENYPIFSKPTETNRTYPYLTNLNEDPLLSNVIHHYLISDEITIGSRDCTIYFNGLSILERHAIIRCIDIQTYELIPGEPSAKIKINGYNLNGITSLQHNDRILFGANHLYVFINPNIDDDSSLIITWEFAQKEIAKVKGYSLGNNLTIEQEQIQEKILSLIPLLSEVNAISEELNKYRTFEIILMPISSWDGVPVKGSKLMVRMKNLINHNTWYWDDVKFFNRSYIIKEHYQKFLDGEEEILYIAKEDDPFWEPLEDILIGTAGVFLQSLAYLLDFDDEVGIVDYKGSEQGRLNVSLHPCLTNGDILTEEYSIDQPDQLLNKPYNFKITIRHIEINNERYNKGLRIRYKIFNELEFSTTNTICRNAISARIRQTRIVRIPNIDYNWLNFFENSCIIFQVFAVQEESKSCADLFKMTTRELKAIEQKQDETNLMTVNHTKTSLPGDSKLKAELTLLQRKYIRLAQKEKRIQKLCREWEYNHDYAKFYQLLSAIAFSSGTKLIPSKMSKRIENPIELYLFGQEEQDYINDIDQLDSDKQQYWDDYYEKIASKQNHSTLSYRMSIKRAQYIERSSTSTTELSSIHPRTNREEEFQDGGSRWRHIIKSKNYYRNNNNSATCIIQ